MTPTLHNHSVTSRWIGHALSVPLVLVALDFGILTIRAVDEEALGREAEQAGKYREAVTHYVTALQPVASAPAGKALTEKIIDLVQKLDPPPAIPEEAERHMVRGKTALETAKNDADLEAAWKEFFEAAKLAPWWADVYFNAAIVREKQKNYEGAIKNLKLYLRAKPNATDAKTVKEKIYSLEYLQEQQSKAAVAQQPVRQTMLNIAGDWKTADPGPARCGHYRISVSDGRFEIILTRADANAYVSAKTLNMKIAFGTIENNQLHGFVIQEDDGGNASVNGQKYRQIPGTYPAKIILSDDKDKFEMGWSAETTIPSFTVPHIIELVRDK